MTRHASIELLAVLLLVALPMTAPQLRAQSGTAAAAVAPAARAATPTADVAQLRWLAGCWELRTPTRVTQESWIAPAFEFLRIELRDGKPTYVAQPGGGPPTAFAATFVSDTAVRFENPQHDFPQGISYRRAGSDSLVASIDGPQGGAPRTMRFPMRRTSCTP